MEQQIEEDVDVVNQNNPKTSIIIDSNDEVDIQG